MKKRIYIDMDDTICDFKHKWWKLHDSKTNPWPQSEIGFFLKLEPLEDAIETVNELCNHYDVWFLSRPSFYNTHSFTEKAEWIKKYFGFEMLEKLILCGNKSLVIGDYLIDDHCRDGQKEFKGEWIQFGTTKFPNWKIIKEYLLKK